MSEENNELPQNKRGRPKGAKNKPKRGRPKMTIFRRKEKERAKRHLADGVLLPVLKTFEQAEQKIIPETLEAKPVVLTDDYIPNSEEALLDSILDPNLMVSFGPDQTKAREVVINPNPVDHSQLYRGVTNIPSEGAQYEFTADMVEEIVRCKSDIFYFAENYFEIASIDKGKHKIGLYEAQKRIIRRMIDSKYLILTASRQCGKSTLMTIYALWMACFQPDQSIVIVANKEDIARKIFKRVRMAYEQLPNFLKPGVKDYAKTFMTLENDSVINVSTTTSTSARGTTISTLIIDEMAFVPRHIIEEFWSSVIPTISSGKKSKMFVVSTPFGTDNKFYEIYSQAEQGLLEGWKAERIDWWDVPGRDEQWKKEAISALGGSEEKFQQEYGNVFLDDVESAVGASVIERFKKTKKEPVWVSDDKEYHVYEYPDQTKLYVVGVDVGEGIGRAASVAQILDVTDLQNVKQVAVYGSSKIEPYHFANKLSTIGQSWGLPPILIERNNCGAQVIDALYYKQKYEKIVSYSKISEQDKYNKTRHLGVLSHTNIRFDGVQNMRYWINHLQTVHVNDPQTISEFETFIKFPNGTYRKRNNNFYDDRVMSLVWALFILEPEICQQYFEIVDYDMQHKPLKIKSNGYWENIPEFYELRQLDQLATIVPKQTIDSDLAFPSLGITTTELEIADKYEADLDELIEMGYEFL